MMRNWSLLIGCCLLLWGCAGDSKEEIQPKQPEQVQQDSIRKIEGEFLFVSDAAVLKGEDFIYGVRMDSLAQALADSVKGMKADEFDLIPVVVKAAVIPNPGKAGWEEVIEIKEILEVPEAPSAKASPIQ